MKSLGKFNEYGGFFVPEFLISALEELEEKFLELKEDEKFLKEYNELLKKYAGRPTPLTYAKNLSEKLGCRIYLKREDLLHSGAHKINNTLGQALLAKKMGKKRLLAETGAGQHGVATAIAGAKLGMEVEVFQGAKDMQRQNPNAFRMNLFGAKVTSVEGGAKTLKDAINEAIRNWVSTCEDTHYLLGSALGPHPYPLIVSFFQSVIGREARKQVLEEEGKNPKAVIACVGGGSNAIGIFKEFIHDKEVELIGVEAGGEGIESGKHAARFAEGRKGVFHGMLTYILEDDYGQIKNTSSVSAGLDYSGVGPEHAMLRDEGRAKYEFATDKEALDAFALLSKEEGIIPALESAHAVAYAIKYAKECNPDDVIIINLSGRGDKDIFHVAEFLGGALNE